MRRVVTLAALALLASPLVMSQVKGKEPSTTVATERSLRQIEQELLEAQLKGDARVFERHLADTYAATVPGGQVLERAAVIAFVKSGDMNYASSTNADMTVRIYGEAAVVTYRSTDKVSYKGQDLSGSSRWTDVFVRQGGRWNLVATHGTRIESQQ